MERDAGSVPAMTDLPSPVPGLGQAKTVPVNIEGIGERAGCGREGDTRRMVHGLHVRKRQKKGPCVGSTKRGKGSKIMAICDGNSLSVSVMVASTSPAEVKLAEGTLKARIVPQP